MFLKTQRERFVWMGHPRLQFALKIVEQLYGKDKVWAGSCAVVIPRMDHGSDATGCLPCVQGRS